MAKYLIYALLIIEAAAALWPLPEAIRVKNNLASWPWSMAAQNSAELIANRPTVLKQEIIAWEKVLTEKVETRDGLLRLAFLNWQLYQDDQAKAFWEQAFYLDPGFVASLQPQLF
ncbi:MAG: hypothetical protein U1C50_00205 [Patescibacteria group bacterium]|nr:hypothetical protein [Patescibacteria group bacterium]MDP4031003.1 hypothetical protein [Candidatus Beckwithbacteria bacterium]MDZ4228656.1 hypothetical protein [Patescibacteria group bacterium]